MQKDDRLLSARISMDNLNVCFYFTTIDSPGRKEMFTHKHAWYEIHIARSGPSVISAAETKFVLDTGQGLLLSPQVYHTPHTELPSHDTFALGFEITKNNKKSEENLYERMHGLFGESSYEFIDNANDLIELYNDILLSIEKGEGASSCRVKNILIMFLFKLSDKLYVNQVMPNKKSIYRLDSIDRRNYILDLLTAESSGNISLSDLSQNIFLTPKQTNRIFKKRYNKTYKQKQIELRIENAKNLLLKTSDSIDKIAYSVGYTNITGFYKAFKRLVGKTPKEYRDEHKQNNS